jgi:hypothetical protein
VARGYKVVQEKKETLVLQDHKVAKELKVVLE